MVKNNGPEVATGVGLVDILPSEVSFVSADASQGNCSQADGVVSCSLGALQPGSQVTVQILVEVNSSVTSTTLFNSAFVEGLEPDSNIDNNSAQEETTISSTGVGSDLSLSMAGSPDPVPPGGTLTYSLAVSNAGPASATEVTLLSAGASQGGCFTSQEFVICILGTLPSGTMVAAEIEVLVDSATAGALFPAAGDVMPANTQTIINSALVQSSSVDFNDDNNSAQVETAILGSGGEQVDLSVSTTDSSDPVEPGASLAASGGAPPYAWSILNGSLPPGLNGDSSGFISGTPSSSGSFTINVGVMDSAGATDSRTFTIEIRASGADPLTITTPSLPMGTVGIHYSASLAATGGAPPYTWNIIAGSLPSGLDVVPVGFIDGTPSSSGTFPLGIEVTDSEGATDSRGFSIFVNSASRDPLTIDTVSLPMGTVGTIYAAPVLASGGTPPYFWSESLPGSLPPGLTVDGTTGFISGIPSSSGSFSFDIEVSDSGVDMDSRTFTIVIDPGGAGLTIDTVSLSNGTVGLFYSASLLASGGTPPYLWVISGPLPPGLTLDVETGLISGTPSSSGSSTFDIAVIDSGFETTTRTFTIVVDP